MTRRIILYELNEVPLRIADCFCRWRPTSTLARTLPNCHQYETHTEDTGALSPWITWPTLHRGVIDEQHSIRSFGQNLEEADREFPPIWKILASHNLPTGVCGSLHSHPMPENLENYTFYLPDTFAAGSECFPATLAIFQDFNLRMARASPRNVSTGLPWASALKLLASAPALGLKPKTFLDVGVQLASERVNRWRKVRRRTFQALLAFDIFMKHLDQSRPAFATFFTNHVASSMHRYWAAAFPNDYETFGYDSEWVRTFAGEIEFTMDKADECLARLVAFVDDNPEYQLWIATSMGQAPTTAEPVKTQLYIKDRGEFLSRLGLQEGDWREEPAMLPRYNFRIAEHKTAQFRQQLGSLYVDGRRIMFREEKGGFFSMKLGQCDLADKGDCVVINGQSFGPTAIGLENRKIDDQSSTTAFHIPEGSLFVYDPKGRNVDSNRTSVSTLDIAPTVLKNFSVPVPSYMNAPTAIGGL